MSSPVPWGRHSDQAHRVAVGIPSAERHRKPQLNQPTLRWNLFSHSGGSQGDRLVPGEAQSMARSATQDSIFFFNYSLHSTLFCIGFGCTAQWWDGHMLYNVFAQCFQCPPSTIHTQLRECYWLYIFPTLYFTPPMTVLKLPICISQLLHLFHLVHFFFSLPLPWAISWWQCGCINSRCHPEGY